MAMHPSPASPRLWRWLAVAAVLALLLVAYWIALQRIGAHLGDSVEQALRPVPGLDEPTPLAN